MAPVTLRVWHDGNTAARREAGPLHGFQIHPCRSASGIRASSQPQRRQRRVRGLLPAPSHSPAAPTVLSQAPDGPFLSLARNHSGAARC